MTRKEIEEQYNVIDGIIRRAGKFEGEPVYVPFFWDIFLDGFADDDDGTIIKIKVNEEDRKEFPELKGATYVYLRETETGFVLSATKRHDII